MAVITGAEYKSIVVDYDQALTQIEGVSQNYLDAAETVLELNIFDPELDLLVPFHNAYLVATVAFAAQPQAVVDAVTALQRHILSKGTDRDLGTRFNGINEYYADESANVGSGGEEFTGYFSANFASLSQQAGFTIESTYIV